MPVRPEKLPQSDLRNIAGNLGKFLVTLVVILPLLAGGCTSFSDNAVDSSGAVETSPQAFGGVDDADQHRLADLWSTRTQAGSAADYQLGPGDLIQVSSPDIDDLKDRTERIGPEGTIALPYVGTVKAAGMTEGALRDEIRRRLGKYVIPPQVDLFVKDYQSRKVVVVGSVERPGLYDLTSGHDTIFDMITRAGGMKDSAAQRVLLITEAASHAAGQPGGYDPSRARPN